MIMNITIGPKKFRKEKKEERSYKCIEYGDSNIHNYIYQTSGHDV